MDHARTSNSPDATAIRVTNDPDAEPIYFDSDPESLPVRVTNNPDDEAFRSAGEDSEYSEGPAVPKAKFSGTPLSGDQPLTVQFTDLSTNTPTSWLWDFGDSETSTEQNPEHEYVDEGSYDVTLTATNAVGASTPKVKPAYVEVSAIAAPVAAFSGTPLTGDQPLTVQFTDASTGGPTSWDWDFGDGGTSTAQSPEYEYADFGDFTVVLEATNAGGMDAETKVDYVAVDEVVSADPEFVQFAALKMRRANIEDTISLPAPPTEGNKLIVIQGTRDGPFTPIQISGFTFAEWDTGGGNKNVGYWWKDVGAGEDADYLWDPNDHDARVIMLEFSGLGTGAPKAKFGGSGGAGAAASSFPLDCNGKGVAIGAWACDSNFTATPVAGYTKVDEGWSFEDVAPWTGVVYKIVTAAGEEDPGVTNASNSWAFISAFFGVTGVTDGDAPSETALTFPGDDNTDFGTHVNLISANIAATATDRIIVHLTTGLTGGTPSSVGVKGPGNENQFISAIGPGWYTFVATQTGNYRVYSYSGGTYNASLTGTGGTILD